MKMMPTPDGTGEYVPSTTATDPSSSSRAGGRAGPPPHVPPVSSAYHPSYATSAYSYPSTMSQTDPHSITPLSGGGMSLVGLERDLALEASAGVGALSVPRSERDSRFASIASSSLSGGGEGRSATPLPPGRNGGGGGGANGGGTIKRKKRVVRRRILKTPIATKAANEVVTPAMVSTNKTPPSLREEHSSGGRGTSSSSSSGGKTAAAGTQAPSIPSPQSEGRGTSYTQLEAAAGVHSLLRPRPAAAAVAPKASLFPDPSLTIDQSALSQDDPLFWLYDVGPSANPRSFGAALPPSLPPVYPPMHGAYGGAFGGCQQDQIVPSSQMTASASQQQRSWSSEDFDFGRQMGKGKFGIVYGATEKRTGLIVALKVLNKGRVLKCGVAPKLLRREVEIQARLNHENIVRLHGYFHDPTKVCLLLQHAPDGDLYQLMSRRAEQGDNGNGCYPNNGALPHAVAASFTAQVASALAYLAQHHVAHRDIKPENLLLSGINEHREPTPETRVKLADFGWAVHAPPPVHHRRSTLCGTPEYVPPEMIRRPQLSCRRRGSSTSSDGSTMSSCESSSSSSLMQPRNYDARYVDSWALGVLVCEMVRGKTPFFLSQSAQKTRAEEKGYSNAHETVFDLIREFQPERDLVVVVPDEDPQKKADNEKDFVSLVRSLLRDDPESRLNVNDVVFHPWVTRHGIECCDNGKRSDEEAALGAAKSEKVKRAKKAAG